jgi:hypothetical protein
MAFDSTPAATAGRSVAGTPGRAASAKELLTGVLALTRIEQGGAA